jgi:hypothetical protein
MVGKVNNIKISDLMDRYVVVVCPWLIASNSPERSESFDLDHNPLSISYLNDDILNDQNTIISMNDEENLNFDLIFDGDLRIEPDSEGNQEFDHDLVETESRIETRTKVAGKMSGLTSIKAEIPIIGRLGVGKVVNFKTTGEGMIEIVWFKSNDKNMKIDGRFYPVVDPLSGDDFSSWVLIADVIHRFKNLTGLGYLPTNVKEVFEKESEK